MPRVQSFNIASMLWLTNSTVRPSDLGDIVHFSKALFLKFGIADSQHFVDNQNLRLEVRGHRKRKPNVHSRRIVLHRRVEKFFDLGKGDDFIELLADFPLRHAEDGAVEEDVLPSGELRMEAGADLEQARNASPQRDPPLRRLGDAAQNLEQRAFSGAVAADDAENLALLDLEAHILERPEFLDLIPLHHLAPANDIGRLARKVADLASDDVAQRRVLVSSP